MKKTSRLTEELLEMAEGMHRTGIMDDAAYRKIIVRHLGPQTIEAMKDIIAGKVTPVSLINMQSELDADY